MSVNDLGGDVDDKDDDQVDLGCVRLFDQPGLGRPAIGHSGLGREAV
jgi:hypothetical protein